MHFLIEPYYYLPGLNMGTATGAMLGIQTVEGFGRITLQRTGEKDFIHFLSTKPADDFFWLLRQGWELPWTFEEFEKIVLYGEECISL